MSFKSFILKIINTFIIKSNKKVYMVPHNNGRTDKYDLINYSADNILSVLNYAKNKEGFENTIFYVECFSEKRLNELKQYVKNWKIHIVPVISDITEENPKKNKKRWFKNLFLRYSCKVWITCTPISGFSDKTRRQINICLSYCTPLKNDIPSRQYVLSYLDYFVETSLLTASIHAAEFKNNILNSPLLGFPRNDNLFSFNKERVIKDWIKTKTNADYSKIIVYAPTYRDYKNAFDNCNVLGFVGLSDDLESFLSNNKILLIAKFHPLQDLTNIIYGPHVVLYEKSFDFTLYDLLALSDMLISDYSSVIHDYILTGKPVVIDSFDYDRYLKTRGFAFEPIDYIFPKKPCKSFKTLLEQVSEELSAKERNEKYYEVQKMFHKNIDSNSSERVWLFISEKLKKNNG